MGRLALRVVRVRAGSRGGALPVARRSAAVVRLDVLAEVVGAHEALVADGAGEALLARVRAQVALQLVGPREPPAAEEPVADERSLACVPAQVRLEVRRLAVHLAAARDVARVDVLPAQVGPGGSEPLSLLAVGAVAGRPARVPASHAPL